MRFPKIGDVAAELRDINKQGLEPEDVDEGIDVRLQVYPDGEWAVRWDLSDYDQDHRVFWGAASVPGDNRRFNSKDVARDLIDQAKEQHAMNDGVEETGAREQRVESKRQPSLPGFPDIPETEMKIPEMGWEQIDGDMNAAKYGGTIARGDGHTLELVKIQPVREYFGDKKATEVGHPFWTREANYDLNDLKKGMKNALEFIGMSDHDFEDMTPTQRALTVASALLDYGTGADEGPSGWSKDIYAEEEVKWYDGNVETIEDRLAEEDEEFRDEILGWGDIKTALEETSDRMSAESAAQGASQLDDETVIQLDHEGFDGNSAYVVAEFDDALAVNSDVLVDSGFARELGFKGDDKVILWSDVGVGALDEWLEKNGYEVTDRGGQYPGVEGYVDPTHLIRAVARETGYSEDTIKEAAETLEWWPSKGDHEIYGTSDGFVTVWAKKASGDAREARRRTARSVEAPRRDKTEGGARKAQRREQSYGSFIVELWSGQTARFHDMPRAQEWALSRLEGQTPGAYAAFYRAPVERGRHPTGQPWTEPFHVLIVNEYGRIRVAGKDDWPRDLVSRREPFPYRGASALNARTTPRRRNPRRRR